MFNRAKLNFVVDAIILVAFIAATVSGLTLLFVPHGGYQGGRNPDFYRTFLLLSRSTWNEVHTWASLGLLAGIGVHLALHWKWIVCMVKRYLSPRPMPLSPHTESEVCPVAATDR